MLDNKLQQYKALKNKIAEKERRLASLKGKQELLQEQLLAAGYKTTEDAENYIDEANKRYAELSKSVEKKLEEAEALIQQIKEVQ